MSRTQRLHPIAFAALFAFLFASPAGAISADDTALFSTIVPPNVMLLVDNSGSMANVVWHPAFDPSATPTCQFWNDTSEYFVYSGAWSTNPANSSFQPGTYTISSPGCVTTSREIFVDPTLVSNGGTTRWSGRYLNWYFSSAADPYVSQITSTNNGNYSSCLGGGTYSLYRRSRVTADQDVLRDVICQVNASGAVRFGIAEFRTGGDPNGGYVWVPANDYLDSSGNPNVYTLNGVSESHGAHLNDAIDKLKADAWTPLAESLFQVYTYFMSRDTANIPVGADGTTKFPPYMYETDPSTNGAYSTSGPPTVPDSPVQYECQKNFVIILTDGEPTKDTFAVNSPSSTALGFSNFANLIGNYDPSAPAACNTSLLQSQGCTTYLPSVAKFMHDNDFRPDMPAFNGTQQTIDVYTIGFTTSPFANQLLQETANVGGGKFYYSNDPNSLAQAIISSISDIIQKSQSFTAATVPATRTSAGGYFYTSLFVPSRSSGYWQGHLKSWQIDSAGNILDANGNCALNDPNAPTYCITGSFLSTAVPFWDAGTVLNSTAPSARKLYSSRIVSAGTANRINFDTSTITPADMNITAADIPKYNTSPYPAPTTAAELTAMVVDNLRGCALGSTGSGCVQRSWKLGDIFHSDPVVVAGPSSYFSDPDYQQFQQNYQTRKRVIIAGANDGFLRFFDAGSWQTSTTPPGYDAGTGKEVAGFMPYAVRQDAKQIPIDTGGRTVYGVDGSPSVADVWLYASPTQIAPHDGTGASQWRTVVVGGLRQGGRSYYALDITNPAATGCPAPETGSGYPCYMWEFPREDDTSSIVSYMGQSWSQPVITKIRVNPTVLSPTATTPAYDRWVAIFGTGYDPKSDPNDGSYDPLATEGRALVMVDLATGKVIAEKKFDPSATTSSTNPATAPYDPANPEQSMRYAIASTPSVLDLDFDGYADVVYVGDLGGNLWKWVIHGIGQDPINGSGSVSQPNWPFQKVFSAPTYTDTSSSPSKTYYKSIFYGPSATLKSGKLWLVFGTGERANLQFPGLSSTPDENNRLYSFVDRDPMDSLGPTTVLSESDLVDLTSSATCANLGSKAGFFFRGADGEKFITPTDIVFYEVLAASYTPQPSSDPCVAGGLAKLYAFKVYCGEGAFINPSAGGAPSVSIDVGTGMPTAPQVSISPGVTGSSTSPLPDRVIINGQSGAVLSPGKNCPGPQCQCPNWPKDCPPLGGDHPVSEFYWRELK